MMPPLRRSIIFWSGFLMMLFIGWAWVDSMNYLSAYYWHRGATRTVGIRHIAGQLTYADVTTTRPAAGSMMKGMFPAGTIRQTNLHQAQRLSDVMPAPQLIPERKILPVTGTDHVDSLGWALPHWVAMLGVALPWSGLLVWRARQHRKAGDPSLSA